MTEEIKHLNQIRTSILISPNFWYWKRYIKVQQKLTERHINRLNQQTNNQYEKTN